MTAGEERGTVGLVTPEGVPLEFHLADPGERLHAFIVDSGLIVLGCVVSLLLIGARADLGVLSMLAVFFFRQCYFFTFELVWNGSTPGKRSAGIRVVSRYGGPLTVEALLARNLMRDLEIFVPLVVILHPGLFLGGGSPWLVYPAFAWVFLVAGLPLFTRDRVRAGDILGGTLVVRVPEGVLPEDPAASSGDSGFQFERRHLEIYGEKELEVLAGILRSLKEKEHLRRDLTLLAGTIARKIGYDGREPTSNPSAFLEAFYSAQRKHLEERLLFGRRKASKEDKEGETS